MDLKWIMCFGLKLIRFYEFDPKMPGNSEQNHDWAKCLQFPSQDAQWKIFYQSGEGNVFGLGDNLILVVKSGKIYACVVK